MQTVIFDHMHNMRIQGHCYVVLTTHVSAHTHTVTHYTPIYHNRLVHKILHTTYYHIVYHAVVQTLKRICFVCKHCISTENIFVS